MLVATGALLGSLLGVLSVVTTLSPTPAGTLVSLVVLAATGLGAIALARRRPAWLGVLLLAVLVRLPYATLRPIHDDGPIYLSRARNFLTEVTSLAPSISELHLRYLGVHAVMGGFVTLFADAGANVASLLAAVVTVPLIGATAATLFDSRRTGLASATLMALYPIHVYYSSWAYSEPITLAFFSLALYGIASERYYIAAPPAAAVFVMRAEYTLFLLVPLVVLLYARRSRLYYLLIGAPLAAFCIVLLSPETLETLMSLTPRQKSHFFYVGFLRQLGFVEAPLEYVARSLSFYAPHFLHWGVPYWEILLVNPIFTVLFAVGVLAALPRARASSISVFLVGIVAAVGFVSRELFLPEVTYGTVLVSVLVVTIVLVLLAGAREDRQLQPLLAIGPYLAFAFIVFNEARYILPVGLVAILYAGYGLTWLYEQIRIDGAVSIDVPASLVR